MGGGRPCLVPTLSRCSWDGFSCVSLGRWLALSEPWFPHLQNEHRFGVLALPPSSVSLLTQEPGRGGGRERGQMKVTDVRLGRGVRRREGIAAQHPGQVWGRDP